MQFEICVTSLASTQAAARAGAHRVELCSALDNGGVTPSAGLIRACVEQGGLPVHVLIRPREGHFRYDERETAVMLADIAFCREAGAAGVVIGALNAAGDLDVPVMHRLIEAAGDLHVTCHRAFDYANDPFEALDQLMDMGVQRLLSSGQAPNAYEGRFLLRDLVNKTLGRLNVMPGGGLTAENIAETARISGAVDFHFTGKIAKDAGETSALPGLESAYWESDETVLKTIISKLTPPA